MNTNIVLGENREFELSGHTSNLENFFFKVKKFGEDINQKITVRLYGGIVLPSNMALTTEERNHLHMKAIYEYKKNYHF